jgi:2,4-dienoyl-CoA reductase-like NADH-dependent reductase (Old Yellow Enzyme family)
MASAMTTPPFLPPDVVTTGTALSANPPVLFSPLKIRSHTFQNRIWVAPMCMYSCQPTAPGSLTTFHLAHLSAFALRGASLTIVEATAVQANGRITPSCPGLWEDSQIEGLKRVVDSVHSFGQKIGIQLAHAGRKASTMPPWMAERGGSVVATEEVGGWPKEVKGASGTLWGKGYVQSSALSTEEVKETVKAYAEAAKRAVQAGVDVIEIHGAHGYLISEFLSPITNRRTDQYGGSFENRIRILLEVVKAIRAVIPEGMPLLVRVSATEWMEGLSEESWTVEQTIELAKLLPALGVDLLDVSSGGNNEAQQIAMHNDFQVGIAGRIRAELFKANITGMLIGAVGMITEAEVAKSIVEANKSEKSGDGSIEIEDEQGKPARADIVLVARQFLREPEWVLRVAHNLGVKVQWPLQYSRAPFPKGSKI